MTLRTTNMENEIRDQNQKMNEMEEMIKKISLSLIEKKK